MTPKRAEYTAKMKRKLNELNTKIDNLESKTAEIKKDAREKYQVELTKLRHESNLAMAKFSELKSAGEASRDKTVAEMDRVNDAFAGSFHYFKTHV